MSQCVWEEDHVWVHVRPGERTFVRGQFQLTLTEGDATLAEYRLVRGDTVAAGMPDWQPALPLVAAAEPTGAAADLAAPTEKCEVPESVRTKLFPSGERRGAVCLVERASTESSLSVEDSPANPLHVIPPWSTFLADAMRTWDGLPRIVVCGARDLGKSTLVRLLVNRCLTQYDRCVLLDGDVGQPELGVPTTMSLALLSRETGPLLSVPPVSTNMTVLHKCLLFGRESPESHPALYRAMVRNLLGEYVGICKESPVPLVVNTMGWVRGLGLELLEDLITCVRPQHIAKLEDHSASKQVWLSGGMPVGRVHPLLSATSSRSSGNAGGGGGGGSRKPSNKDMRELRWLRYLVHGTTPDCEVSMKRLLEATHPRRGMGGPLRQWRCQRLLRVPWVDIDIADPFDERFGPSTSWAASDVTSRLVGFVRPQCHPPTLPNHIWLGSCAGFGIVERVEEGWAFVRTPEPVARLSGCRTLSLVPVHPPLSLLYEGSHLVEPFLVPMHDRPAPAWRGGRSTEAAADHKTQGGATVSGDRARRSRTTLKRKRLAQGE